jgi:hypothetical protein
LRAPPDRRVAAKRDRVLDDHQYLRARASGRVEAGRLKHQIARTGGNNLPADRAAHQDLHGGPNFAQHFV